MNKVKELLPNIKDSFVSDERFDEIARLSTLFGVDEVSSAEIIVNDIDLDSGEVDLAKFSKDLKWQVGHIPSSVRKKNRTYINYFSNNPLGEKVKLMEETPPSQFLRILQNDRPPVQADLNLIDDLSKNLHLAPSVINVLIDYCLTKNNNVLSRSYVEKIAASLVRENIKNAVETMNYLYDYDKKSRKKKNVENKQIDMDKNEDTTSTIENENAKVEQVDDNTTTYTLNGNTVTATNGTVNNNAGTWYKLNNSNIMWGVYSANDSMVNVYQIDNCTQQNSGTYSFVVNAIEYNLIVRTEDRIQGLVTRGTLQNVPVESIEDTISYGETLNRIFDQISVDTAEYHINKALKAIRNDIHKAYIFNLTNIYIGGVMVTPNEDGSITYKQPMNTPISISFELPAGYDFDRCYDGNGAIISTTESFTLPATNEENRQLVLAFTKDDNLGGGMGYIWWIIGGSVAGILLVGFIVFIIVKKRKDNSYKKMYY